MTAALKLNLVQSDIRFLLRFSWLGLVIMLVSLALLTLIWRYHASLIADQSALEAAIRKTELALNEKKPKREQKPKDEITPKVMKALQAANSELQVPWTPLLNTLEESQHRHVALLEVQPNSKKQHVLIIGEAKTYANIIAYIDLLESQSILQDVYLQKHELSEDVAGKPVKFTLGAMWVQGQGQ